MRRQSWLGVLAVALSLLFSPVEAATKKPPTKATATKKAPAKKAPAKKTSAKKVAKHAPVSREVAPLTKDGKPNILSGSAIAYDLDTGEIIFSKNADEQRPIASISKLAAALAVRKNNIDLEASTEISKRDAEIARRGSDPHVEIGWKLSNKDLVYAALIASENRAVPAMGRGAGLDETQLVREMNSVAKDLGLKKTVFDETTGLSYGNQSSAREVAVLLQAAMKDKVLADAMTRSTYDIAVVDPVGKSLTLSNTNKFIHMEKYTVLGAKTGYNDKAGYCLATSMKLGERRVAFVVLGAHEKLTRYGDVTRMYDWLSAKEEAAKAEKLAANKK
jgi:D-alanyl-D-alanine endopeptidase (penicillin-binding protein 7)